MILCFEFLRLLNEVEHEGLNLLMTVIRFHFQASTTILQSLGSHYAILRHRRAAHILRIEGLHQDLARMKVRCKSCILSMGDADFVLMLDIRFGLPKLWGRGISIERRVDTIARRAKEILAERRSVILRDRA